MSLLNSIGSIGSLLSPTPTTKTLAPSGPAITGKPEITAAPDGGFGKIFEGLVNTVDTKQKEAQAVTKQVLMGDSDQLHQSMISMQEASVAFSMMIEVRNKVVESYQELMRMPV